MQTPLTVIKKFWFADARAGLSRVGGACLKLINFLPNLTGEQRLRPGYSAYSSSDGGSTPGLDAPANTDILHVLPIESPSSENVHLWLTSSGIKMNPWWKQGIKYTTTDLLISETQSLSNKTVTYTGGANVAKFADPSGLVLVADYYNWWTFEMQGKFGLVQDWDGVDTMTFIEDVQDMWGTSLTGTLRRHFHDNLGFTPAYNNDKANPPVSNVENSIIRFSGGQGSAVGLRPVIIFPNINKTIFPNSGATIEARGTFVNERELRARNFMHVDHPAPYFLDLGSPQSNQLERDKTYWIAVSCIYDSYQESPLTRYESSGLYVGTSANKHILVDFSIVAGLLNLRITGLAIYIAQDVGDTTLTGRVTPYRFVDSISLLDNGWTFSGARPANAQQYFEHTTYTIGKWNFDARGVEYQLSSGIIEIPLDTIYAHSTEEIVGGRRILTNCYVQSESTTDRQNVFTNPIGGNTVIGNNAVIATDMFSNEEAIYRLRVEPTVGTRINAIRRTGIDTFIGIKDRGIIECRIVVIDRLPQLIQGVISHEVGTTTVNCAAEDDDGYIYFPSYQDFYRYRTGAIEHLIERPDKNDWLETYRDVITVTDKENAVVFYIPELKTVCILFGNQKSTSTGYTDMQYFYSAKYGWQQIWFKEVGGKPTISFKWITQLRNGHIIGLSTDATPVAKRIMWKHNGTQYKFYFSDDGTAIAGQIDTGEVVLEDGKDFKMDKATLVKIMDLATQGTLDCEVYLDNVLVRTFSGQDKTEQFLHLNLMSDDPRLGYTFRLKYNTNSTRERLNTGEKLQLEAIMIYGDLIPRSKRVTEASTLQL